MSAFPSTAQSTPAIVASSGWNGPVKRLWTVDYLVYRWSQFLHRRHSSLIWQCQGPDLPGVFTCDGNGVQYHSHPCPIADSDLYAMVRNSNNHTIQQQTRGVLGRLVMPMIPPGATGCIVSLPQPAAGMKPPPPQLQHPRLTGVPTRRMQVAEKPLCLRRSSVSCCPTLAAGGRPYLVTRSEVLRTAYAFMR
ncbi:hypothetical protein K431DRAFT_56895 [Polychaeton citri CBS 116435]|uniref:Uncharacterized protein n=1 Tax=Polychaeton citri CBS 116435 TaxID=1314669 RepID=A0A9P4UNA8_9PEZI|nr:hypothetical protein K431DRAFT_56895 [Polychaeton citri CBS 116435]